MEDQRKVISEGALSSGRCRDCPPRLPALADWPSTEVLLPLKTLMAVTSPFLHSPVLSPVLLPPAGLPSHASTSSSCSETTPSPVRKHSEMLLLCFLHILECKPAGPQITLWTNVFYILSFFNTILHSCIKKWEFLVAVIICPLSTI